MINYAEEHLLLVARIIVLWRESFSSLPSPPALFVKDLNINLHPYFLKAGLTVIKRISKYNFIELNELN